MSWVEIVVSSKAELRKALGAGFYDLLEESDNPVKVILPWATLYFPLGVTLRKLRDLCNDLKED